MISFRGTGVGIALGALVVLCLLGALAWWYFTKAKNDSLIAKAKAASTQKAQAGDMQVKPKTVMFVAALHMGLPKYIVPE